MRPALAVIIYAVCACGSPGDPGSKMDAPGGGGGDGRFHDASTTSSGPNYCRARDCGSDGSGGSCGTCGGTFACDDNLGLCIPNNGQDVGITWQGQCWYVCPASVTYCTPGERYQAMQFDLQAAYPINATLYFDDNCDPTNGTDNLNDTGAATPTQIDIMWFVHHHDEKPSSAVWWAGHHSSGCVDYTTIGDCP